MTTNPPTLQPAPGPGRHRNPPRIQRPLGVSPEAPEYVVSWAKMTSGIEDYALWQEMFEGRSGKDAPPFRRGRCGVTSPPRPKPGQVVASSMTHPLPGCAVMQKSRVPNSSTLYLRMQRDTIHA